MASLPIPQADGALHYSCCRAPTGDTFQDLLMRLGIERIRDPAAPTGWLSVRDDPGVHLDPDLDRHTRARPEGWRPLFGQVGASQTHLSKHGVGPGDVFLFFGWFCSVIDSSGTLRYRPRAEHRQVVFGWLEVGEVLDVGIDAVPAWAAEHPHIRDQHFDRFHLHNTLYVSIPESTLVPGLPGGGIFRWHPRLQLTKPRATPSVWQLPRAFHPDYASLPLTRHSRDAWDLDGEIATLRSARIGQEFITTMTEDIEAWTVETLSVAQ